LRVKLNQKVHIHVSTLARRAQRSRNAYSQRYTG